GASARGCRARRRCRERRTEPPVRPRSNIRLANSFGITRTFSNKAFNGKESMSITRIFSLVFLCGFCSAGALMAAESPAGRWNTVDEKSGKVTSVVELYDQGGKLFGKIAALTEPNDEKGKPKICTKCAGADKDKPIVGLVILKNLGADGDRFKGGTI